MKMKREVNWRQHSWTHMLSVNIWSCVVRERFFSHRPSVFNNSGTQLYKHAFGSPPFRASEVGPNAATPPSFLWYHKSFPAQASTHFMLKRTVTPLVSTSFQIAPTFSHSSNYRLAIRALPTSQPAFTPSSRAFKSIGTKMASATGFYDFKPLDSMYSIEWPLGSNNV